MLATMFTLPLAHGTSRFFPFILALLQTGINQPALITGALGMAAEVDRPLILPNEVRIFLILGG